MDSLEICFLLISKVNVELKNTRFALKRICSPIMSEDKLTIQPLLEDCKPNMLHEIAVACHMTLCAQVHQLKGDLAKRDTCDMHWVKTK